MVTKFITHRLSVEGVEVPVISTVLNGDDIIGTIKTRWDIGRHNYIVSPGLYAVGNPGKEDVVLVTANYKLTFDYVRKNLKDINAWILVLDTKGVNVWCAAGKGTFGTEELIKRIRLHLSDKIISHKKIIVPQLGAVGVSAYKIKSETGFNVIYGPVKASDIITFIRSGYRATPQMREVKFPLIDRIKLIPVELSFGKYYLLGVLALFFILSGLNKNGYNIDLAWNTGSKAVLNLMVAYLAGTTLTPILLPYIPFKSFSLKGIVSALLCVVPLYFTGILGYRPIEISSWILLICGISSFLAMNFTGSSTYTSLSGVQKEMKQFVPVQIISVAAGLVGWITLRFF